MSDISQADTETEEFRALNGHTDRVCYHGERHIWYFDADECAAAVELVTALEEFGYEPFFFQVSDCGCRSPVTGKTERGLRLGHSHCICGPASPTADRAGDLGVQVADSIPGPGYYDFKLAEADR